MIEQYKVLQAIDHERLAGTAGEQKAAGVICSCLDELGIGYTREEFALKISDSACASIEVDGVSFVLEAYRGSVAGKFVGELCYLEQSEVIEFNKGAYKNKIILSYTTPKNCYKLFKDNLIKGFVRISNPYLHNLQLSVSQNIQDTAKNLPVATITYDSAKKLLAYDGKQAVLCIEQKVEKRLAQNIVAEIPGTGDEDGWIYLVAHYDTVAVSHGAADNGAGTVNILKAAEYFKQNPSKRNLRIIFFSGEELGLLGSWAYVEKHKDEIINDAKLVINVDMSGDPIGRNLLIVLGTEQLLGYAAGVCREDGIIFVEKKDIYSSDCMPFACYQIPSINIARVGGEALHYGHTRDDVAKYITPEGLKPTYNATIAILKRVLNANIFPVRTDIDNDLKEKVENYYYKSQHKEPKLHWRENYKNL